MKNIRRLIAIFFLCCITCGVIACRRGKEWGRIGISVPVGGEKVSAEAPYLITAVNDSGPAFRAGIRTGDRIVRVNGVTVEGRERDYIYHRLLRGDAGTTVAILIERNGALRAFTVKRGRW